MDEVIVAQNEIAICILDGEFVDVCEKYTSLFDSVPATINIRKVTKIEKEEKALLWTKSLVELPIFTWREIEIYRLKSGKLPISKTLIRGEKSEKEGYLKNKSIFSLSNDDQFNVKSSCYASMKSEWRYANVTLNRGTSECMV